MEYEYVSFVYKISRCYQSICKKDFRLQMTTHSVTRCSTLQKILKQQQQLKDHEYITAISSIKLRFN